MKHMRLLCTGALVLTLLGIGGGRAHAESTTSVSLTLVSDVSTEHFSTALMSGHSFIVVQNKSSQSVRIGAMDNLQPGHSVSLGTWGNKVEHKGLWYNLEVYYLNSNPTAYLNAVSITKTIDGPQIEVLNDFIMNHDSHGGMGSLAALDNCSSFSTGAWNSVNPWSNDIWAGMVPTPLGAYYSLSQHGSAVYGAGAKNPNVRVYFANGKGPIALSSNFVAANLTADSTG